MTTVVGAPSEPPGALARAVHRAGRRRASNAERCDLCSAGLAPDHRHLLDTDRREVICACRPCSVLFVDETASTGHYRLVPLRRARLEGVSTRQLGVPVGLAFFVRRDDDVVVAHYPSPLGATQWELDDEVWQTAVLGCPALGALEPEVQALLVNTAHESQQRWLVGIDDCFRLVAIVRGEWRGMSGGSTVWPQIQQFFGDLTERR